MSYQHEPLAEVDASNNTQDANDIEEEESDEDGLTAATLEARYERETPLNNTLQYFIDITSSYTSPAYF